MRIQSLRLKDFRSHEETVLELDRFNFIRGPNGCGKSSIQMALEFLLTGRCEMTDAAGRGAEDLIRNGAKEFLVSATFEDGETICRRRSARAHTVEVNGNRVPVEEAQSHIEKRFGPSDVLSAVLNVSRFTEMAEAEQKRLLAKVLDAGRVEVPHEVKEWLRSINEVEPRLTSVADVEAAHKHFYELRTEATRALKALGKVEKPDVAADSPTSREVRKRLDDLRAQKERVIAQSAEGTTAWEAAQTRLRQVQAEMETLSAEILGPDEEQRLEQIASEREDAEKLRQELADLAAKHNAVETSIAEVGDLGSKCPRCRQPISKEAQRKELERLRKSLAHLEDMIQGAKEELSEYLGIEQAAARLETHRRALARRAKLVEEQSELQGVQKPDAADFDGRVTILAERIRKGEGVLERVQRTESATTRWEKYVQEKAGLERRINLLDRLVEFFGPCGAMMAQAQSRIGSFTEKLNRYLAPFKCACRLTLEPLEVRVQFRHGDRFDLSLRQLSESEQFRFTVAFQAALAQVAGLRFVVIDRADVLDKARRKLLTGMLVNSGLEQAIVLATSEEPPPLAFPDGVKFLDLSGAKQSARDDSAEPTSATLNSCSPNIAGSPAHV
jgi:DNA repair exonuclease SbcCD ATPase subunit